LVCLQKNDPFSFPYREEKIMSQQRHAKNLLTIF
jgi:hypothetical protein